MNENYGLMQYFLDMFKEFAKSNPEKQITPNFIYSNLIRFNISNEQFLGSNIRENFSDWYRDFYNNPGIGVFYLEERPNFLWFEKGEIKGNEIKLYIPLDSKHIKEGANQLFRFLSTTNIEHQSKIADRVRNDNIVVRVNRIEDVATIANFVENNQYIREGMLKVNPFLPNFCGIGMVMDNSFSFNSILSDIIAQFVENLRQNNRLDLCTVENLNMRIKNAIPHIKDLDKKDIYSLLARTTTKEFAFEDFLEYANNKLVDEYAHGRTRIIDPKHYLEKAIRLTEKKYPGNAKTAILEYINGNPNYFTNDEKARDGLLKYVNPKEVNNIIINTLREGNSLFFPSKEQMIERYLEKVLNISYNYKDEFETIVTAYINTMSVYGEAQANFALKELYTKNITRGITNRFGDRVRVNESVLKLGVKTIILSNISIENIDINNLDEVLARFKDTIGMQNTNNNIVM